MSKNQVISDLATSRILYEKSVVMTQVSGGFTLQRVFLSSGSSFIRNSEDLFRNIFRGYLAMFLSNRSCCVHQNNKERNIDCYERIYDCPVKIMQH